MPTPEAKKKRLDKWAIRRALRQDLRDALLFLGGMSGIAHETILAENPREALLLLFGAMIGVIPFLRLEDAITKMREEALKELRDREQKPELNGES